MAMIINVYLWDEIADLIKEEKNKSALINKLLKEYYESTNFKMMSKEQLEEEMKRQKLKEEYETKLQELKKCQHQKK